MTHPVTSIAPGHFGEEFDRVFGHWLLDPLAHSNQAVEDLVITVQFGDVSKESHGYGLQRICRPLAEPVDGAAVDQGRELPQSRSEDLTQGAALYTIQYNTKWYNFSVSV